jgi:hypothetical protein
VDGPVGFDPDFGNIESGLSYAFDGARDVGLFE